MVEAKELQDKAYHTKPPLAPSSSKHSFHPFMTDTHRAAIEGMIKTKPKHKKSASDPGSNPKIDPKNIPDAAPLAAPLIFQKNTFFIKQFEIFPKTIDFIKTFLMKDGICDISHLNLTTRVDFELCLRFAISGRKVEVAQELFESVRHPELQHHRNTLSKFLMICCQNFVYTEPEKSRVLEEVQFIMKHCQIVLSARGFALYLKLCLDSCTKSNFKQAPNFHYSFDLFWIFLNAFRENLSSYSSGTLEVSKIFAESLTMAKQKLLELEKIYKAHHWDASMLDKTKTLVMYHTAILQNRTGTLLEETTQNLGKILQNKLAGTAFFGPLFTKLEVASSAKKTLQEKASIAEASTEEGDENFQEALSCLTPKSKAEMLQLDKLAQNWMPKFEQDLKKIDKFLQELSLSSDNDPYGSPTKIQTSRR